MIEAEITVISCDRCREKLIVLRNEAEREEYWRTWFDDGVVNFCPNCRAIAPAKPRTKSDNLSESILGRIF